MSSHADILRAAGHADAASLLDSLAGLQPAETTPEENTEPQPVDTTGWTEQQFREAEGAAIRDQLLRQTGRRSL
jgi:hypothetical protein